MSRTFEILFGLHDSLDDGTGAGIVFAEEGGSWMVGVDWKTVLTATAAPAEFVQRAEAMIRNHCHGEQVEMPVLARSVEMSPQQSAAREGRQPEWREL